MIQIGKLLMCCAYAAGGVWLRFANPQMTETELILNFWPYMLGGFVVTGFVLIKLTEMENEE